MISGHALIAAGAALTEYSDMMQAMSRSRVAHARASTRTAASGHTGQGRNKACFKSGQGGHRNGRRGSKYKYLLRSDFYI